MSLDRAARMPASLIIVAAVTILVSGCSGSGAAPLSSTPAVPTQVLGSTPQPAPTTSGQPTSSGQRVNGTVQTVAGPTITLTDGRTLELDPNTSVIRVQPATPADLAPQEYVAITATRQQDGTLLASMINVFAESQRGLGAGQRPMAGGNLMTNATITSINGDTFTASFPGGDAMVKLAPDVKVMKFVASGPQDITAGKTISALVVNDVARSISIQ